MTRSSQDRRQWCKRAAVLATALTLGLGAAPAVASARSVLPTAPAATAAASTPISYQAEAFGTSIMGSKVVSSGQTALANIGCTSVAGVSSSNDAAGASFLVGTVGAITDTASSTQSGHTRAADAGSTIAGFDLEGKVEASGLAVTSESSVTSGKYATAGSATFTDLVVAGTSIPESPAPNTSIPVPGLGALVLNQQTVSTTPSGGLALTVRAIDLHVSVSNTLGLPAGLQVIIGEAHTALTGPIVAVIGGKAFASRAEADNMVTAGDSALVFLACDGTAGKIQTNTTVGVSGGGLATSGTATSTAEGTVAATTANGQTTDTIQGLSLANGLVKATAVVASASLVKTKGQPVALSAAGSSFTGLTIAGLPGINDAVPPNTVVPIPGVGTLYLHQVIQTATSITVHMVELVLTVPVNGDPIGTKVILGSASVHID